ncbi:MAG: hypothetical protein IJN16_08065 [Lachnospiraceae bacterium]|nr:hypothetical protein [Lachnospiraceae bacterium]
MYRTEQELKKELRVLYDMEKAVKEKLKRAPKGNLRISNSHAKPEYYYKQEGSSGGNGSYIKKKDLGKAIAIAQRDYDKQLLRCVERRIVLMERFVESYVSMKLEGVYDMLNPYRKELVTPSIVSDEEYVKQWVSVEYQGKHFEEGIGNIITEKGERVRSKSEKIIADKLYAMGIPYRYEYPITLSNGIRIYPDFTMLKMPERKEVYLEHFGLLDEESYLEATMRKLNSYSENGIVLGDNLLISYETSRYPLSTKMLDGMLRGMRGDS